MTVTEQLPPLNPDKVQDIMRLPGVDQRRNVHNKVLGAASIAQVNLVAKQGEVKAEHVIKFRYPGLTGESVRANGQQAITAFTALSRMAERTGGEKMPKMTQILGPFSEEVVHEIDFRNEVRNMTTFCERLKRLDIAAAVRIPQVVEYSKFHIVMGRIGGVSQQKLANQAWWKKLDEPNRQSLRDQWCTTIWTLFVQSLQTMKFVHTDPNQGNYLLLRNGEIGLIDFGSAYDIDDKLAECFINTIHAMARYDVAGAIHWRNKSGMVKKEGMKDSEYEKAVGDLCDIMAKLFSGEGVNMSDPDLKGCLAVCNQVSSRTTILDMTTFQLNKTLVGLLGLIQQIMGCVNFLEIFDQKSLGVGPQSIAGLDASLKIPD